MIYYYFNNLDFAEIDEIFSHLTKKKSNLKLKTVLKKGLENFIIEDLD